MNSSEIISAGAPAGTQTTPAVVPSVSHWWVTSYPWATSLLYAFSRHPIELEIKVYDCSGYLANSLTIRNESQLVVAELDPLLGACKLQAGVKQAHLVISSPNPDLVLEHHLGGRDGGSFTYSVPLRQPFPVTPQGGCFFPIQVTSSRSSFVALLNCGADEAIVRGRFFVGKRSPESSWVLPPNGVSLISVEEEFATYLQPTGKEPHKEREENGGLAYLRLGTKVGNIAAILVERSPGLRDGSFFSGVSG